MKRKQLDVVGFIHLECSEKVLVKIEYLIDINPPFREREIQRDLSSLIFTKVLISPEEVD
jgi:hypothetical protein